MVEERKRRRYEAREEGEEDVKYQGRGDEGKGKERKEEKQTTTKQKH